MPGGTAPAGQPPFGGSAGTGPDAAGAFHGALPAGPDAGLRSALGGLTTRGRSFLAAGAAAAACAYLLGQPDLLRVGLLLAALPLVAAVALHRTRHRVAAGRRLHPSQVPAACEARVHLRLENASPVPTGLLMLQDQVPYVLGPRPRFVLEPVEPRGHREVTYRVRSDLRGRYRLGPLHLRLADPFGMCELARSFGGEDTLTVVPRIEALPPVRLTGRGAGGGESRAMLPAPDGEDDVIPRGYRHGDDLRRVHWRSTARHGQLMVRREEQPHQPRCTVLLDTRGSAYHGSGPDCAFEWAVTGAASVAVHLLEGGFATRLATSAGASVPGLQGVSAHGLDAVDAAGLLLDALAVVEPTEETGLEAALGSLRDGTEGLLVAFTGELDEGQAAVLARLRLHTEAAVAFVLDGREEESAAALRTLREAGWTALPVLPGDVLADLWRQADRGGRPEEAEVRW